MADVMPIIPNVGQIWIHTGNTVNWNRLKRKLTQEPREELTECITSTLSTWLEEVDQNTRNDLQYATELECVNKKFIETISEEKREEMKVTVKIFLSSPSADSVKEAVDRACVALGISNIEIVLVSLPEGKQSLENLQPVWEALQDLVEQEKIFSIGVSDLDKATIEQLYDWARVKPCLDQVNLESCCVMPADLVEYAKEKDIQLLTHSDPQEILTEERLQELVGSTLTLRDSENWQPSWVVRYSVLVKSRGIIHAKGYITKGERDIKRRNTNGRMDNAEKASAE